jgi:hypothetical protein
VSGRAQCGKQCEGYGGVCSAEGSADGEDGGEGEVPLQKLRAFGHLGGEGGDVADGLLRLFQKRLGGRGGGRAAVELEIGHGGLIRAASRRDNPAIAHMIYAVTA